MNIDSLLMVLLVIKNDKQEDFNLSRYLDNAEIGMICNHALEEGLIIRDFNKFRITSKGNNFIEETNKSLKRKGLEKVIVPYSKYKTAKLKVTDIYIPNKF